MTLLQILWIFLFNSGYFSLVPEAQENCQNVNDAVDTILVSSNIEGQLYRDLLIMAPVKSTTRRDSLSNAIVLEIDTIPKGWALLSGQFMNVLSDKRFTKSIFYNHRLHVGGIHIKLRTVKQHNWSTSVLILIFILIGVISMSYRKRLYEMLSLIKSFRLSGQLRQEHAFQQRSSIIMLLIFILSAGLLICYINRILKFLPQEYAEPLVFFVFIGLGIAYIALKLLITSVCGYIFKVQRQSEEYNYNQLMMLQLLGVIFALLLPVAAFSNEINVYWFVCTILVFSVLGFIFRMISTIKTVSFRTFSAFYIFLYLCTIEFLPIVVVIKLIK